jgi:hypothetical protein
MMHNGPAIEQVFVLAGPQTAPQQIWVANYPALPGTLDVVRLILMEECGFRSFASRLKSADAPGNRDEH